MVFAGLEKLRILKSNCEASRKLRILPNFGNLERLDNSENVEQTRTTRKRTTQKEMLETLKTQNNYKKQRTLKKQRNYIIRKTTLPPAGGRDVPQKPLHLWVFTRSNLAAWPGLAAWPLPGNRIVMLESHMNSHTKPDLTAQNFGCRPTAFWDVCGFKLF